ncbi:MAG: ABC transporter permease [Chloroflexi bacterium]|nr:ABC transporter permease [Ardenticatenaceae bacterium]MBL1130042.1 ABC transporter permease [Chloroflexota bacterium]NOG36129.1 ABC transporter permease [Chloroflexota bacterium]GIK57852.1 MAG: ABC transporter permease [Chloroflexota bacterium]
MAKQTTDQTGFSDVAAGVDAVIPARKQSWLQYYLPSILIFIFAIVTWELFVRLFSIQEFLLPAPSAIYNSLSLNLNQLLKLGWFTTKEALGGFAIGCSLGILVALATARWTIATEALMPFAIAANSVPILAFAPILNNWFGVDNPVSKMAIVAVIVFFPVMINTVRGLTLVDANALELMASYAANQYDVLFRLRVPNALPYIFNALKVAAALSMIGAIVSEYFGGNRSALGVYITQEAAQFRFANAWAAIILACIVGITLYLIVLTVERFAIPWHPSVRGEER